jgi:hypothetical protein
MSLYYYIWISNVICSGLYCLLCWYWYNCSPSCLRLSFHNHISHIIVEYKRDHWLSKLMLCKLQHGILEEIWYLQFSKSCQVVECPWLDWCNLIIIQITTTYKIRTKYNDNLRPNKHTESRNQNQRTEGKWSERERTRVKQCFTLENYSFSNRNLMLDTKDQDGK